MKIRHSSLPKLALCGQYESAPGTSPAAERGTKLDAAFRHIWTTSEFPNWDLPEEDASAVRWAINECLKLGGIRDGLTTSEFQCRIFTAGMDHRGTADGVALKGRWLVDLKSGQIYDYRAQMAAYALGLMETHFEQRWTTHLLFCDQRQVVSHEWTYRSAYDLVRSVLDNVGTPAKENDYCGWCARSLTCSARVQSQSLAVQTAEHAITPQDGSFLAVLQDPERLGLFLRQCATLEDFRDAAKAKARELLEAKQDVPGWRLQKPRVSEYVDADHVAAAVERGEIGAADAIRAGGALSLKKAEALWSAAGAVIPDQIINRKIGQAPLVAGK